MDVSNDPRSVSTSHAIEAAKDIMYGSMAGMLSKILEHPFDLAKVRLQSQLMDATARFDGPIDCLKKTYTREGFRGLYRGLPAPVFGAMAENATVFVSYNQIQKIIRWTNAQPDSEAMTLPQLALAGTFAGAVTSFVLTPIELVKCKMQVQMLAPGAMGTKTPQTLPGPLAVIRDVIRKTGFRGLWLGQVGTLLRETVGTAAWFTMKEFVGARLLVLRHSPPRAALRPWESALAGACAGVTYNVVLFPADTVKTAMQTGDVLRPDAVRSTSFWITARSLWHKGGLRGLYAGCGITVARSMPGSALIFVTYDGLKNYFG